MVRRRVRSKYLVSCKGISPISAPQKPSTVEQANERNKLLAKYNWWSGHDGGQYLAKKRQDKDDNHCDIAHKHPRGVFRILYARVSFSWRAHGHLICVFEVLLDGSHHILVERASKLRKMKFTSYLGSGKTGNSLVTKSPTQLLSINLIA